ncbi:MAG: 2-phospho-L-lactate guanylyltransferase [Myxococcota bacterium]|jgi:2-phospho-L-lactate/phosphoenolpyruvate guanylyltransferase|nr:2-phospho-L-lactate guanylyltransferase [Myxococcota bacterium]
MTVAVVPVKSLASSKSRLLPELPRDALQALSLAMLEDLIRALQATPAIETVAVATPDDRVAEHTRSLGAEALHGPDPGLNAAIDAAPGKLGLVDDAPLLIVLGDVPGARPNELQQLFEALDALAPGPAAVLAPSRDGGTSALLRRPHRALPSCFGPQSATKHREAAQELGVPLRELPLDSLAIDLDRAEDLESFLALGEGGDSTRQLLKRLDWPGRAPNSPKVP